MTREPLRIKNIAVLKVSPAYTIALIIIKCAEWLSPLETLVASSIENTVVITNKNGNRVLRMFATTIPANEARLPNSSCLNSSLVELRSQYLPIE